MIKRFEEFTSAVTLAYKYIIKIKAYEMKAFGLKASHVMCLFHIGKHEEGLTAGELGTLCMEDKAAISKALAELKKQELIMADDEHGAKVYRAKYYITEKGAEIHKTISAFLVRTVEEVGKGLSVQEWEDFYHSFAVILNNLQNYYKHLEKDEL